MKSRVHIPTYREIDEIRHCSVSCVNENQTSERIDVLKLDRTGISLPLRGHSFKETQRRREQEKVVPRSAVTM